MQIKLEMDLQVHDQLKELQKRTGARSIGELIRRALNIHAALISAAMAGYGQVVVRNKETGGERVLIEPPAAKLAPQSRVDRG